MKNFPKNVPTPNAKTRLSSKILTIVMPNKTNGRYNATCMMIVKNFDVKNENGVAFENPQGLRILNVSIHANPMKLTVSIVATESIKSAVRKSPKFGPAFPSHKPLLADQPKRKFQIFSGH